MNPHDRLRIVLLEARQEWRAFSYVMQVHENHSVKRAGVAGIRARAIGMNAVFSYVKQVSRIINLQRIKLLMVS
ncbi:hypothetical protein [Citrobacter europaeus]|uniref:hypothetical protein n=1 Tax=Citrobacter europaeus TaxID=1914243 RepID=UPI003D6DF244